MADILLSTAFTVLSFYTSFTFLMPAGLLSYGIGKKCKETSIELTICSGHLRSLSRWRRDEQPSCQYTSRCCFRAFYRHLCFEFYFYPYFLHLIHYRAKSTRVKVILSVLKVIQLTSTVAQRLSEPAILSTSTS